MNHTPFSNWSSKSAATWSDRRVLPVPPGPVSVTRRCPASSCLTWAISASRPMKDVSWTGKLLGMALKRFQRRKVMRQICVDSLPEPLGVQQAFQSMLAQVG